MLLPKLYSVNPNRCRVSPSYLTSSSDNFTIQEGNIAGTIQEGNVSVNKSPHSRASCHQWAPSAGLGCYLSSRVIESGGCRSDGRFPSFIDYISGWLTFVHSGQTALCFILYPPYLARFRFILIMFPHSLFASLNYNPALADFCVLPHARSISGNRTSSVIGTRKSLSLTACARKEKVDVTCFRPANLFAFMKWTSSMIVLEGRRRVPLNLHSIA